MSSDCTSATHTTSSDYKNPISFQLKLKTKSPLDSWPNKYQKPSVLLCFLWLLGPFLGLVAAILSVLGGFFVKLFILAILPILRFLLLLWLLWHFCFFPFCLLDQTALSAPKKQSCAQERVGLVLGPRAWKQLYQLQHQQTHTSFGKLSWPNLNGW